MSIQQKRLLPVLDKSATKYSHGKVAILAGSAKYPGAAVLCVGGARRGGAGFINYLRREDEPSRLVISAYPDVVPITKASEFAGDCWVIGSGAPKLSRSFDFPESRFLVLDGEVMAIATNSNTPFTVITPHEGEAKKLGFEITGVGNKLALARKEAAIAMAKKLHVIVVLKGQNTVIASPDGRSVIDRSGGSELATAGTGDILAGLIGSMLASWKPENLVETTQVVAKAVKLHGLAGALAAKSFAPVVATDVLDALAKVSVKFN